MMKTTPASHAEINAIVNSIAPKMTAVRLAAISQTARQWQRLGLSSHAIRSLVGCVPVRS